MTAPLDATELPGPWPVLLDEVRRYPSPHNSQPITVRVLDERRAQVFYDLDRGLPAESFGIPFAHVCAGVFLESLVTVAAGHGWAVGESLRLAEMDFSSPQRQHLLGTAGELVVTVTRPQNIDPRIRYNIHDRGHVLRMRDVLPVLRRSGLRHVLDERVLDLPLLLQYGRSDQSVDHNGAVVPPDGVRDAVAADPELLAAVESHRLVSYEDAAGDRQLHVALQLAAGRELPDPAAAAHRLLAAMRRANRDLDHAIATGAPGTEPTVGVYPYRTGLFAGDGARLKNEYRWTLDAAGAATAGLDVAAVAGREQVHR